MKPFSINVSESILQDLQQRLKLTRWPDQVNGADWHYGTNLEYLKELAAYWQYQFNWRKQEARLNTFKQFTTTINGLNIHFIYERGKGPNPLPLIMTHGWPSSCFEFQKIIPMLTDPAQFSKNPAQSFDVIVPSLPGFGFSEIPHEPAWNIQKIADVWFKLMTEVLGYQTFYAHGGDLGTRVTARLAAVYPDQVKAIYTNSVKGFTPMKLPPGMTPFSPAETQMIQEQNAWLEREGGYSHLQSTKPQTIAYALNDSPVGLAAYLIEKYRSWSDCNGVLETRFSKDELLTILTVYWATQTINSSMRLYYECKQHPWFLQPGEKITIPCAVACFAQDNVPPVKDWAERFYNLKHWREFSRGGHFPAFEEPELLADDLREFFYSLK